MGGCTAINCKNHSRKGNRMFQFPKNPERRKIWLINMRRESWTPGPTSQICSDHFEDSQFEQLRADGWKKLKSTAVPTLFDIPNPPRKVTSKRVKGFGNPKPGSILDTHLQDANQLSVLNMLCFAFGCNHRSGKNSCSFYRFPTDEKIHATWTKRSRRSDRIPGYNDRLCSCHFIDGNRQWNPSIFNYNDGKQIDYAVSEKKSKKMGQQRHCFIPGCHSGYQKQRQDYKKEGKQIPSLFSVKKDDYKMLQLWREAIPKTDREFSFTNKVCEIHFKKDDVITHFVHSFPDGSTQTLKRERPMLRPGAVPSIFPRVTFIWLAKHLKKTKTISVPVLKKKKEPNNVFEDSLTTVRSENTHQSYSKSNSNGTPLPERVCLSSIKVEDNSCDSHNLLNAPHKTQEEFKKTDSSVSELAKCVTHTEAFSAAETLLHYVISQDDVSNADINFILNLTKKIKLRLSLDKAVASVN